MNIKYRQLESPQAYMLDSLSEFVQGSFFPKQLFNPEPEQTQCRFCLEEFEPQELVDDVCKECMEYIKEMGK